MTARPDPSTGVSSKATSRRGLAQGGLGGPQEELLESGQEEVFSRTEVESGSIEHHAGEDPASPRAHQDADVPDGSTS